MKFKSVHINVLFSASIKTLVANAIWFLAHKIMNYIR